MDTNELISHSRARFDHHQARIVLKEKYQAKLTFAHAGGMWRAGPELQSTIFTCGKIGEVVLLDLYETPVKVDTTELMSLSQQRWQEQMNAWLVEYEDLNKNR
jgi:hypothetical protein